MKHGNGRSLQASSRSHWSLSYHASQPDSLTITGTDALIEIDRPTASEIDVQRQQVSVDDAGPISGT